MLAYIYSFCTTDVKLFNEDSLFDDIFDQLSFFRYCDPPFIYTTVSDSSDIITERVSFFM